MPTPRVAIAPGARRLPGALVVLGAAALAWGLPACNAASRAPGEGQVAEDVEAEQIAAYLTEPAYRRQALEDSLANRDNGYALLRLENYGQAEGWEALPESSPRVAQVVDGAPAAEVDAVTPWEIEGVPTRERLLEIGRQAFFAWPGQPLPQVELVLRSQGPERAAAAFGLWRAGDGRLGGLVQAFYPSGGSALAGSCATCHARVMDGQLVAGPPSDIALGFSATGEPPWRDGVVDVTPDGVNNPVAMPDLRATVHQTRLHWTGNVYNGLIPLAIRIETLLITNSGGHFRPPREVALGLALYVQALGEAQRPGGQGDLSSEKEAETGSGAALFVEHCQGCHADETGAGDWVPVEAVGTDAAAARSGTRGTGGYRVPSLWRAAERVRWLHTGYAGTLDGFFQEADGARAGEGHLMTSALAAREQALLIAFLRARF